MKKILFLVSVLVSSIVESSSLEQGKLLFNQGKYKAASIVFNTKKNSTYNAEKLFWLAAALYKQGLYIEANKALNVSAQNGGVNAMLWLLPKSNGKCMRGHFTCSKKWKVKLLTLYNKGQIKDCSSLATLNYYYPQLKNNIYLDSCKRLWSSKKNILSGVVLATENSFTKKKRFNYILRLADLGYARIIPSLCFYYPKYIESKKLKNLLIKAVELGFAPAAFELAQAYLYQKNGFAKNHKQAYFYWELYENLKSTNCQYLSGFELSKKEKDKIESEVLKYIKDKNIKLNEFYLIFNVGLFTN